jgi:hypothetical protein
MMGNRHVSGIVEQQSGHSRRSFLGGALVAAASGSLLGAAATLAAENPAQKAGPNRKPSGGRWPVA